MCRALTKLAGQGHAAACRKSKRRGQERRTRREKWPHFAVSSSACRNAGGRRQLPRATGQSDAAAECGRRAHTSESCRRRTSSSRNFAAPHEVRCCFGLCASLARVARTKRLRLRALLLPELLSLSLVGSLSLCCSLFLFDSRQYHFSRHFRRLVSWPKQTHYSNQYDFYAAS